MQKGRKEQRTELSRAFQFPLLASCCIPPIVFFPVFFSRWVLWYFPPLPSSSLTLSLLSLTPRQFSPDRFHSVLEGMDLIALWGLVGCAGLGCLISVPCRDWFNASWSWNCLIVQPSGDSPCLRRPAGLAKHCSRLLLYAAGGWYASGTRSWSRWGINCYDKQGHVNVNWTIFSSSPEQTSQECLSFKYLPAWCCVKMIQLTINALPIFKQPYSVSLW